VDDFVFIPMRNGRGNVDITTVGGDYNIKDAVDLDYFTNELFAGLRVPKAFLGWEEAIPGSIGSTTLTKLDSRYARTVKRVQKVLKSGIRDMIDFYCQVTGISSPDYSVNMSKISTADDSDILDELQGKTDVANSLLQAVTSIDGIEYDKAELMQYIVENILNLTDIVKFKNVDDVSGGTPGGSEDSGGASGEDVSAPPEGLGDNFKEPGGSEPLGPEKSSLDKKVKKALEDCYKRSGKVTREDVQRIMNMKV
jgi:hypothetical protein